MELRTLDILIVEDNTNDGMLAQHVFHRQNMADQVHVVRDGAEALEYIFCTGAYDGRQFINPKLILLDLSLPLVSGLEVLKQIRRDLRTRLIPVVVLSSSNEERDIFESYSLGANSYIVKPVDFDQFSRVAKQLAYYWLLFNRQPNAVNSSLPPNSPGTCVPHHMTAFISLTGTPRNQLTRALLVPRLTHRFSHRDATATFTFNWENPWLINALTFC